MDNKDRDWHEAHGYQVTNASEWLGLTPEEDMIVRFRVAMTLLLKRRRNDAGISQAELARRIGTSQSRIAFMEGGQEKVSTDLLLKAIGATGATIDDLAEAIAQRVHG